MDDQSISGLAELLTRRLPLNRKERYYTGTVLPMIVCCDEFAHFGRFLKLCGVPDVAVVADPASTNVQFFTEYGFKESLFDGAESRFQDPGSKETPDIVVYIESHPSVLLCIEAKVFSKSPISKIKQQVQGQAKLLSVMGDGVRTQPDIYQVALLPSRLGAGEQIADARILSWELVADTFRDVAPAYWISVLDDALKRYDDLVSKGGAWEGGGKNADAKISGQAICDLYTAGDTTFTWMGRDGGRDGAQLTKDLKAGRWKTQKYEVRHNPISGNNRWFPIKSFVDRINLQKPNR